MSITKALIIADPWIGLILGGSKTWEMRSTAASHRGLFGLIRKGTGAIQGVASLIDVGAPLSPSEMIAEFSRHRIPEEMISSGKVSKWNTPWKLADVRRLGMPISYCHKSGAVTWVALAPEVSDALQAQLDKGTWSEDANSDLRTHTDVAVGNPGEKSVERQSYSGFIGEIELTQANIDYSHIYLRGIFDRFPEDAVGGSNRHEAASREVSVDWGASSPVYTDLDGSKRFFRARGWIKGFFDQNAASPGDTVVVEETGPYQYRVSLRKIGSRNP